MEIKRNRVELTVAELTNIFFVLTEGDNSSETESLGIHLGTLLEEYMKRRLQDGAETAPRGFSPKHTHPSEEIIGLKLTHETCQALGVASTILSLTHRDAAAEMRLLAKDSGQSTAEVFESHQLAEYLTGLADYEMQTAEQLLGRLAAH